MLFVPMLAADKRELETLNKNVDNTREETLGQINQYWAVHSEVHSNQNYYCGVLIINFNVTPNFWLASFVSE